MTTAASIIHAFYRRMSYTSAAHSRPRCRSALNHVLRIKTKTTKELEWLDEFAHKNLLWRESTGIIALNTMPEKERQDLVNAIAPSSPDRKKKTNQNKRRRYRDKIKKAIRSERKKGNEAAAKGFEWVLAVADDKLINIKVLDAFEHFNMKRRNQRVSMLEKYIHAHNALVNVIPNANLVYLQEGIFKIPHQWNITTDIISTEQYITVVRDFLQTHFPDYPIELITGHHDERMLDKETGEYKDTGAHSHYFLSGRNSQTGKYDLHRTQIKVVNEYIKRVGPEEDHLPDDEKLSHEQTRIYGYYFQRMFYDYFNEHLLNPVGLRAEFAPETERKSEQRQRMNREAKQPKQLRSHNLATMQADITLQRLNALKAEETQQRFRQGILEKRIEYMSESLALKESQLADTKLLLLELTKTLQDKSDALKRTESLIEQLSSDLAQRFSTVLKDVYVRTECRKQGLDNQAQQYLIAISNVVGKDLTPELQNACVELACIFDDSELVNALSSNEKCYD